MKMGFRMEEAKTPFLGRGRRLAQREARPRTNNTSKGTWASTAGSRPKT